MNTEIATKNNTKAAVVTSTKPLITDVQVTYETGCTNIALNKEAVCEGFFVLSTCLAGEILQKFVNYGVRFAIYGDFSHYTSKPLRDFMYESNQGRNVYFQPNAELAVNSLCGSNDKSRI